MKTTLVAVLVMIGSFGLQSAAHEDHNHEAAVETAPNGGILRNAPPYKAELVLEKDNAKVFVYDKDVKPVEAKRLKPVISGQLAFPKDKSKKSVKFELKGNAYQAKLTGIDKVHRYDLHVTLEIDGKPVLADFGVDNIH